MSSDIFAYNVGQELPYIQPEAEGSGTSIDDGFLGVNWIFESNDLNSDFAEISLSIEFNQENGTYRLGGNSGVNGYFAGCIDHGNGQFEISNIASTKMGGAPEDMAKEGAFMEYMRNFSGQNADGTPVQVTIEQLGDQLILHGLNGHEIVFAKS